MQTNATNVCKQRILSFLSGRPKRSKVSIVLLFYYPNLASIIIIIMVIHVIDNSTTDCIYYLKQYLHLPILVRIQYLFNI